MSRELLEQAGYNPDKPAQLTAENACGAAVMDIVKARGCLPATDKEVRSAIAIANDDLIRAGLEPVVDYKMYDQVAGVVEASGIIAQIQY
jgi:hypothetical protein